MKKIILIIFLTSIFAEYNNPNGKPLTLNVGTKLEFSDEVAINIYANMPITSWLTINGGYYQDRYEYYWASMYQYSWEDEATFSDGRYDTSYDVFYVGAELHIPLGSYLGF